MIAAPLTPRCPAWSGQRVVRPDPQLDPAVRVALHAPEGFRADLPWAVILHLHGSGDCGARAAWCGPMPRDVCPGIHVEAPGDCTAAMIDAAGFNAIVATPQLHMGSSARFPAPPFGDDAYAARFVAALAAQVPSCGEGSAPLAGAPVALAATAHSLGATSLEHLVGNPLLRPLLRFVAVLDGVSTSEATYLRWLSVTDADRSRRLVVVPSGVTAAHALAASLQRDARAHGLVVGTDVPFEDGAPDPEVRIVHSAWAHGLVPVMYLHKALRLARLPLRDPEGAPPWRVVVRAAPQTTRVEALPADLAGSLDPDDGAFADGSPFDEWSVAAPPGAWIRVRASAPGTFEAMDPMLVRVEGDGTTWCDDAHPGAHDRGEARAAEARWRAPTNGRVVFRVRTTATGWPRGAYRVRVERAE